jgi:DNA-binding transcriptional LysR family regulator
MKENSALSSNKLSQLFARIELKLLRGTATEVVELLKNGEAELAIASELSEQWERLDRWPLFTESFHLVVNRQHHFASQSSVDLGALREQPILLCSLCENAEQTATLIRANNPSELHYHEISLECDLLLLVEAGLGVAITPRSTSIPASLARVAVNGTDFQRTVYVYGVAGRQRSTVASAILSMLRAADWSQNEN